MAYGRRVFPVSQVLSCPTIPTAINAANQMAIAGIRSLAAAEAPAWARPVRGLIASGGSRMSIAAVPPT